MLRDAKRDPELFSRDTRYLNAHYHELLDQYPEQWIAILDEHVVGAASDLDDLLAKLAQAKVPIERAVIEQMSDVDLMCVVGTAGSVGGERRRDSSALGRFTSHQR